MQLLTPQDRIKHLKKYANSGLVFRGMDELSYFPFFPGCLYYICSRPSVGKTALALSIAKRVKDGNVLFASAEMDEYELRERLLKMGGDNDKHIFLSGDNYTIEDIICDLQGCEDVQAVFVDYLQLMIDSEEDALDFVLQLRRIAAALNIPVFLTSHLLPSADDRPGGPCNLDLPFNEDVEGLAGGIIYLYDAGPYVDNGKPVNAFITSKFTAPKTVELFFSTETFSFN